MEEKTKQKKLAGITIWRILAYIVIYSVIVDIGYPIKKNKKNESSK